MSEDPKGFDAGDYNLFRYCGNDPEDRTDPMGLQTIGDAAERAAMAQRNYMQSLSAADRFHIGELAGETSLQGNAAASMVNAYNNGSGGGSSPWSSGGNVTIAQLGPGQAGSNTQGRSGAGARVAATVTREQYSYTEKLRDPNGQFIANIVHVRWTYTVSDKDGRPIGNALVKENISYLNAAGFDPKYQQTGNFTTKQNGTVTDNWSLPFNRPDGQVTVRQVLAVGNRTATWDATVRANGEIPSGGFYTQFQ